MKPDDDLPLVQPQTGTDQEGANDTPIPAEILEKMPPPMRDTIKETFGLIASGGMGNPIAKKVTSAHIDKLLDNGEAESKREHSYRESGRFFALAYVVIAIVAFFVLAWMFGKSDPELFKQVLTFIVTFGAGFAGGWGINAARTNKDD